MRISLPDLVAAHQAYAKSRNDAIARSTANGDGPEAAARLQREALLDHLQMRLRLLEEARDRATARFEAEIAQHHQKDRGSPGAGGKR
jgi:hypothetical protein